MKRLLFTVVIFLSLVVIALSQPVKMNPAAGHLLFTEKGCNQCHSIWGVGGELGPDLGKSSSSMDIFELAGSFWNHSPEMMSIIESSEGEWPNFSEDEMARLMSYFYTLNLLDEPGNAEDGFEKLEEKRCFECHTLSDKGRNVAGSLDKYAKYTNMIPLAEAMWNAGSAMRRAQISKEGIIPHFEPRDMADIQAAIRRNGETKENIVYLPPPDIENGKKLYNEKTCSRCHGTKGQGGNYGPSLIERGKTFGMSSMAGSLWNHSYAMVENIRAMDMKVPKLENGEMADIISYLYYESFMGASEGNPVKGEDLYSKRGCSSCHMERSAGKSGVSAPSLSRFGKTNDPIPLITAMWNHAPAMRKWMSDQSILWPSFKKGELKHIWAYLQEESSKHLDKQEMKKKMKSKSN